MSQRNFDPQMYEKFILDNVAHALVPTRLTTNVPLRLYPEVDDYTMSLGMAMTLGGRIWLGWFGGGDNDRAVILISKSDDGGKTFSPPQFLLDGGWLPNGLHVCSVVANLWTDPDGRLWLFYSQGIGWSDGRNGCWATRCDNPDSDSPTWSEPVRIWHGCALNKPTVLSDGSWLLPINLWQRDYLGTENSRSYGLFKNELFRELDPERKTHAFVSRDKGKTWEKRGSCVNPAYCRTFDEPMVVQKDDGTLIMYQREIRGMTICASQDRGYTWTEPEFAKQPGASARFFFTRLASGKFMLVQNCNPKNCLARSHMTAFLSDDGIDWYGRLVLDERHNLSYPDGFQAPDGRIFVQYDRDREHGEIVLAIFTEEDVAAGKAVSGKTLFKHPVIQSATKLKGR